ncbi:hypothetical protein BAE44_0006380 [Dichanthelium oligosanthes]|uniref:Uncharacterized protein n=1 Tax=Dichanthelium oligosanthes TaxID=888268 RepID=A0A1E5W5F3_9POAL|nr:hypothetical protein BAE44_0006380 [Dichanthelium oligosanthes]
MHQLPINCYNDEGCTLFYGLIGFSTERCMTSALSGPSTGFVLDCLPV